MESLLLRLGQRNMVTIARPNVHQLVPAVASRADEIAPLVVNLRLNGGKHDLQPAMLTFPHGALPEWNAHITAATANDGEAGHA